MKTKKVHRKLGLNKKTIVNLEKSAMSSAVGGFTEVNNGCVIITNEDCTVGPTSDISYCVGCPTNLTCNTCAPYTCDCTGNTYDTCNADMCGTVYPFPCQ